ncbi:MAG: hypothetical protein STSR0008_15170 [Ignavibacterium sp.]
MKYIFLLLSAFVFSNCTYHSLLPQETLDKIPKEADQVILSFDIPKDSLFTIVTNFLLDENYRIYNSDKQIAYISTDWKFIDDEMIIRLNIKISEKSNISELSCKAEWTLNSSSEENPKWYQAKKQLGGYFDRAFEEMVLSLEKLPYKEIKFVKN